MVQVVVEAEAAEETGPAAGGLPENWGAYSSLPAVKLENRLDSFLRGLTLVAPASAALSRCSLMQLLQLRGMREWM